jgi:hypothetical protein
MAAAVFGALAVGLISWFWAFGGESVVRRAGPVAAAVAWLSPGLLVAWSLWKLPFRLLLAPAPTRPCAGRSTCWWPRPAT